MIVAFYVVSAGLIGFVVGSLWQLHWYGKDLEKLQEASRRRDAELTALCIDLAMFKQERRRLRDAIDAS